MKIDEKKKVLIRRICIFGAPVLLALVLFGFVISNKKKDEKKEESLFMAEAEKDSVPSSKTKIYDQAEEEQMRKKQEAENSQISDADFFTESDETNNSSAAVSQQAVQQNIRSSQKPAQVSYNRPQSSRPSHYESQESQDELERLYQLQHRAGIKNPAKFKNLASTSTSTSGEKTPGSSSANNQEEKKVNTNPRGRSRNYSAAKAEESMNVIAAVIHSEQTVKDGSRVKIRITQEVNLQGSIVPANSFVSGICHLSKNRLSISINSIVLNGNIIAFNKNVYDKDGMEGIYVPENIRSEAASEVGGDLANQAVSTVATSAMGLMGTAINASKNMLQKKRYTPRVTLKSNYKIYLK
jgi:conjugative transposon TraM protein